MVCVVGVFGENIEERGDGLQAAVLVEEPDVDAGGERAVRIRRDDLPCVANGIVMSVNVAGAIEAMAAEVLLESRGKLADPLVARAAEQWPA